MKRSGIRDARPLIQNRVPGFRKEEIGDTECAKQSWRQIEGESPLLGKG